MKYIVVSKKLVYMIKYRKNGIINMKKIAICVPSLAIGGAERFAVDLAISIDKSKFKVMFLITRTNVESFLKSLLEQNGIQIVDLAAKDYPTMLHKQLQFLRKERPDVVHAQTGSILHMMLACKICNIPNRLYTVHNEANLLYGSSILKKEIYKMGFSFFGFKPVAICPTVKQTLIEDMGISENQIVVVNNGVDIKRFTPVETICNDGVVHIISVGTLYWIKNQLMTIHVVSELHRMGYKVELTLLGDGVDRDKIQKEIERKKAENYIFAPGSKKNVEDYLRKADIYVSASKTEGLPLSILEAMACGLPVVATDAGGTKDIVKNGVNGFLVKVDDEEEMRSAIQKIIDNKILRREYSYKSREIAEQWSAENCTRGYEAQYYL